MLSGCLLIFRRFWRRRNFFEQFFGRIAYFFCARRRWRRFMVNTVRRSEPVFCRLAACKPAKQQRSKSEIKSNFFHPSIFSVNWNGACKQHPFCMNTWLQKANQKYKSYSLLPLPGTFQIIAGGWGHRAGRRSNGRYPYRPH